MRNRALTILGVVAFAVAAAGGYWAGRSLPRLETQSDNEELRRLYEEDQADRAPGQSTDWTEVGRRDRTRRSRAQSLIGAGSVVTALDYYHAAMLFQHGDVPEDFLLAHELAVFAITKGKNDREARLLAVEAEDRFLTHIGRSQRFATQFDSEGAGPWRLKPVDLTLSDDLRRWMGAPSMEEAKAQEAELNKAQPGVYSVADAGVTPPIGIRREMPAWHPSSEEKGVSGQRGLLELVIDEHGNPMWATVRRPTVPSYDQMLMAAVPQWRFTPATRNGEAVRYRVMLDIELPSPKR